MFEQWIFSIIRIHFKFTAEDKEIIKSKTKTLYDAKNIFEKYDYKFNDNLHYLKIRELNDLVNVLKHGLGDSKERMIKEYPRYFEIGPDKYDYSEMYCETLINANMNITEDDLDLFIKAIIGFIKEMPNIYHREYDNGK